MLKCCRRNLFWYKLHPTNQIYQGDLKDPGVWRQTIIVDTMVDVKVENTSILSWFL